MTHLSPDSFERPGGGGTTPARTSPCARDPPPLHMAFLPPRRVNLDLIGNCSFERQVAVSLIQDLGRRADVLGFHSGVFFCSLPAVLVSRPSQSVSSKLSKPFSPPPCLHRGHGGSMWRPLGVLWMDHHNTLVNIVISNEKLTRYREIFQENLALPTTLPSTQTDDTQRGGKGHKLLPAP